METQYGFTKMNISEFESWMANFRVGRTIIYLQQHHTVAPAYQHFNGTNHFQLQRNMKDYHVGNNGWMDIGQHFSIFPDGAIVTGRSLELTPTCIYGNNSGAICIENVGFFDAGVDAMSPEQSAAIVRATAAICKKFGILVNTDKIVYHNWFHLSTGSRNNGTGGNKTCPGTAFFGGNKVDDCENHFLPLVRNVMAGGRLSIAPVLIKYVSVTANALNVRIRPTSSSPKASDRKPMVLGSVLRVFEEQNNWYRISSSQQHWVSARYTDDVERAEVNATVLNVRSGAGTSFAKVGSFLKNQEVFVYERSNGWCRVSLDNKWVKDDFLDF